MSRSVRTVLGDIDPGELGRCDAHEHLLLVSPLLRGHELDDRELATADAHALRAAGADAVVEWTPLGLGRDLDGLASASRASGLHIVAATGLHRDAHYSDEFWGRDATPAELADLYVSELEDRCGMIKVGASYHRLTAFERRAWEAAAAARERTGAPVCVHLELGTCGPEAVEAFGAGVVLAHLDRNPDPGLHRELAQAGAWLSYDGVGRIKYGPDSSILELIEAVGPDRVLLGGDQARRTEHPIDWLFRRFVPRLDEETAARILVTNPAQAFAWR